MSQYNIIAQSQDYAVISECERAASTTEAYQGEAPLEIRIQPYNNGSLLWQYRRLPSGWNWSLHLPSATVSFNISLFAVDHPEMTSDGKRLSGLFLTDYCKALPSA